MNTLVAEGRTTGPNQSESLIFYTKLNLQRLQKWDKIISLDNILSANATTAQPQVWWLITEAWCGDAAQSLPVMAKIAEAAEGRIDLRIIMRDEHPDIMDHYLTNGGRSIPKLIATDIAGNELYNWGPRPEPAQQMMMDWRANNNGKSLDDIEKELHLWYAKDKGQTTQEELLKLL